MKLAKKITFSLVLASTMLFVGCQQDSIPNDKNKVTKVIDDKSLGLREDIFNEDTVVPEITQYSTDVAGTSTKIERAFEDAPPMIPHSVEGMLPITINNNQCASCHTPGVAESLGALPFPKSHMTNFRPEDKLLGDVYKPAADVMKNETVMKEEPMLTNARFNCSACHAPQSGGQLVENKFVADFITKDGKEKSNWIGKKILEGLK